MEPCCSGEGSTPEEVTSEQSSPREGLANIQGKNNIARTASAKALGCEYAWWCLESRKEGSWERLEDSEEEKYISVHLKGVPFPRPSGIPGSQQWVVLAGPSKWDFE